MVEFRSSDAFFVRNFGFYIVNLCEMKFYGDEYLLNKEDYFKLMRKSKSLSSFINKKQVIRNILITTFGLRINDYSSSYQDVITIDDLFR